MDVLQLDQNVTKEGMQNQLLQSETEYREADHHLVIGTVPVPVDTVPAPRTKGVARRAWCLHEIGVRAKAGRECYVLRSIEAGSDQRFNINEFLSRSLSLLLLACTARQITLPSTCRCDGQFFEGMDATVKEDLEMIKTRILATYGSPDEFDEAVYRIFNRVAFE